MRLAGISDRWIPARGDGSVIVFLPLLAAIVAGLGNRMLGNVAAKLITTGALFVGMALSWPIFLGFLAGTEHSQLHPVLDWVAVGRAAASTGRCASTR